MFEGLSEYIRENLQAKVTQQGLNDYEIFGKEVESPVSDLIEEFLQEKGIKYSAVRAKSKNEFPDLKLTIGGVEYALEHKAGESSQGPNNDMGTLNAYPNKIEKFGDRIFCTFVKYSKATKGNGIVVNDIYFDKIYTFVGTFASSQRNDILKYRKKDGNLRPKVWNDFNSGAVYTGSLDEFKNNIDETVAYRAEQLVLQHIEDLTYESKVRVYDNLGKMIGKSSQED
ncbi:MAG: hypothetical protein RSE41_06670 [Clostridia bacterium]